MTIDELRKISDEATPKPWTTDLYYLVAEVPKGRPGGEVIGKMGATAWSHENKERDVCNTKWVSAARTALPALLDFADAIKKARHCAILDRCSPETACPIREFCDAIKALDKVMGAIGNE